MMPPMAMMPSIAFVGSPGIGTDVADKRKNDSLLSIYVLAMRASGIAGIHAMST